MEGRLESFIVSEDVEVSEGLGRIVILFAFWWMGAEMSAFGRNDLSSSPAFRRNMVLVLGAATSELG